MLKSDTGEVTEIIDPVSSTCRAATSARRKPELAPVPAGQQPAADQHPAFIYLASLAPGSRRGVRSSLQMCSELLSTGGPWVAMEQDCTPGLG